jgi:hypothetical protein
MLLFLKELTRESLIRLLKNIEVLNASGVVDIEDFRSLYDQLSPWFQRNEETVSILLSNHRIKQLKHCSFYLSLFSSNS